MGCLIQPVFAQELKVNYSLADYRRQMMRSLQADHWFNAMEEAQIGLKAFPNDTFLLHKSAYVAAQLRLYETALNLQQRYLLNEGFKNAEGLVFYARLLYLQGKYAESLQWLGRARKVLNPGSGYKHKLLEIENLELRCNISIGLLEKTAPINFEVNRLEKNINSKFSELSPFRLGDTLLFSTLFTDSIITEDAYPTYFKHAIVQEAVRENDRTIDLKTWGGLEFHSLSDVKRNTKGQWYGTQSEFDSRQKVKNAKIVQIKFEEGKNIKTKAFVGLPAAKKITQPHWVWVEDSLGEHEHLFFSAELENGWGGMDIWVLSKLESGQWKLKNAGPEINTPGNEVCPFYDVHTQSLWFASDGIPGYGGLDIWYAKGTPNGFEKPLNVGKPLNSSYDEQYPSWNAHEQLGYFVSNRPGGTGYIGNTCCDDVFEFKPTDIQSIPQNKQAMIEPKEVLQTSVQIFFPYNSDSIPATYDGPLEQFKKNFVEGKQTKFKLEAHTDDIGTGKFNQDLAQRRAAAVLNRLQLTSTQVQIQLFEAGAEPLAPQSQQEAIRSLNRKVKISVITP